MAQLSLMRLHSQWPQPAQLLTSLSGSPQTGECKASQSACCSASVSYQSFTVDKGASGTSKSNWWLVTTIKRPVMGTQQRLGNVRRASLVVRAVSGANEDDFRLPELSAQGEGSLLNAAGLILGTAVGPGILGLPTATLSSGLLPSIIAIICAWLYVIAGVLLVAENACHVLELGQVKEVSFTSLALHTAGRAGGSLVAVVYALLNYALLVACLAGLGNILQSVAPFLSRSAAAILVTGLTAAPLLAGSFKVVEWANALLCTGMLGSIALLLLLGSRHLSPTTALAHCHWRSLTSALPVTVLTLGFHVITPLVCSILKGNRRLVRKAVLLGGVVPLLMVLAWNAVILGLAVPSMQASPVTKLDPIKLLLSLGTVAAPAIKAFALCALGTTLIGYALSFPSQLLDTLLLLRGGNVGGPKKEIGQVPGWVFCLAIGPPLLLAVLCPEVFAKALDFAGVYANCFLFGIMPPVMSWMLRYGQHREPGEIRKPAEMLRGGRLMLLGMFLVSVALMRRV